MSLDQRTPIRQVSKKKARDDRLRQKAKKIVLERSGGNCEAASAIANYDFDARKCRGPADYHEVLTRGRRGSASDPENMLYVCRKHHDWIEMNPRAADLLGLTRPSEFERERRG